MTHYMDKSRPSFNLKFRHVKQVESDSAQPSDSKRAEVKQLEGKRSDTGNSDAGVKPSEYDHISPGPAGGERVPPQGRREQRFEKGGYGVARRVGENGWSQSGGGSVRVGGGDEGKGAGDWRGEGGDDAGESLGSCDT